MKILQAIKEKNGDSEIRAKNEKFLWPTRLPSKLRNCFLIVPAKQRLNQLTKHRTSVHNFMEVLNETSTPSGQDGQSEHLLRNYSTASIKVLIVTAEIKINICALFLRGSIVYSKAITTAIIGTDRSYQ